MGRLLPSPCRRRPLFMDFPPHPGAGRRRRNADANAPCAPRRPPRRRRWRRRPRSRGSPAAPPPPRSTSWPTGTGCSWPRSSSSPRPRSRSASCPPPSSAPSPSRSTAPPAPPAPPALGAHGRRKPGGIAPPKGAPGAEPRREERAEHGRGAGERGRTLLPCSFLPRRGARPRRGQGGGPPPPGRAGSAPPRPAGGSSRSAATPSPPPSRRLTRRISIRAEAAGPKPLPRPARGSLLYVCARRSRDGATPACPRRLPGAPRTCAPARGATATAAAPRHARPLYKPLPSPVLPEHT